MPDVLADAEAADMLPPGRRWRLTDPGVSPARIAAVILAAGRASRMGREKVLLPLDGEPLVKRSVRAATEAGATKVLVVVNPHNRDRIEAVLADLSCDVVCNERFEEGIGGSIALAAATVQGNADALLLMQADQPLIDAAALCRIIDVWRTQRPNFVASSFGGTTTTPVLFSDALIPELRNLTGDTGARQVIERHVSEGRVLESPAWQGKDVDTDADYESIRSLAARGSFKRA